MTRARVGILTALVLAPFVFLTVAGAYHLYITGWSFIAWWPMTACLFLAYGLGWYWTRKHRSRLLPATAPEKPPAHWTDADTRAWDLIARKAATVTEVTPESMTDADRYAKEAIDLATAVAKVYHPTASDPFSHLTLPEILTCAELVSADLSKKVREFVPGSHVVTINNLKQAKQLVDWGQTAWNVTWLARMAVNPLQAGIQFLTAKAGGSVLNRVQSNVLVWFHTAYLHELGRHLIELNSGRLKVGADRYRDLMATKPGAPAPEGDTDTTTVASITVAVVGQVKAGKSSLVNALLGEQRAVTDVVPVAGGQRYELRTPGLPTLTLVDTAGYGEDGLNDADLARAVETVKSADVVLFVAHARTAARRTDGEVFDRVSAALAAEPNLRWPPVLVAVTHVDLLTPAMEWAPPYDWRTGDRKKELSIREAVSAAGEILGSRVQGAVPVCAAAGRVWNVTEELQPLLAAVLDDAHGTNLLRIFHRESSARRVGQTIEQVLAIGRETLRWLRNSAKR
jgi:uncharacterized protein